MVGVLTLLAKLYMSSTVRSAIGTMSAEESKKFLASPEVVFKSKTQLNEAEYSPILFAMLMTLHFLKVDGGKLCYWVSIAAPAGQFIYFYGRLFNGKVIPFTPAGALPRYWALAAGMYLIYKSL